MIKLFEEFFVCPKCKKPLCRKEDILTDKETRRDLISGPYCMQCGTEIASAKKAALAMVDVERNLNN